MSGDKVLNFLSLSWVKFLKSLYLSLFLFLVGDGDFFFRSGDGLCQVLKGDLLFFMRIGDEGDRIFLTGEGTELAL